MRTSKIMCGLRMLRWYCVGDGLIVRGSLKPSAVKGMKSMLKETYRLLSSYDMYLFI
jgi:hypothetical protein